VYPAPFGYSSLEIRWKSDKISAYEKLSENEYDKGAG
jgi:hypothetical protein